MQGTKNAIIKNKAAFYYRNFFTIGGYAIGGNVIAISWQ